MQRVQCVQIVEGGLRAKGRAMHTMRASVCNCVTIGAGVAGHFEPGRGRRSFSITIGFVREGVLNKGEFLTNGSLNKEFVT